MNILTRATLFLSCAMMVIGCSASRTNNADECLINSSCNDGIHHLSQVAIPPKDKRQTPKSAAEKNESGKGNSFINTKPSQPKIYFAEQRHDFGDVQVKTKVEYIFSFSNTGDAPLEVINVHRSCGCTATTLGQKILKHDELAELKVIFYTGSQSGKKIRRITVETNDPETPQTVLTISANVLAPKENKSASADNKTSKQSASAQSKARHRHYSLNH